jgi:hypothetical protein
MLHLIRVYEFLTMRPQQQRKVPRLVEMADGVPAFPLCPMFGSPPAPSNLYEAALIYVQSLFKVIYDICI